MEDPYGQVVALTASPGKAMEWGVDETRILGFSRERGRTLFALVVDRFFPRALAMGWDAFEELLEGAATMDRHFRHAEPLANIPLRAAFVDQFYARILRCQTRGVFAYDERLKLLPSYLQQLEMESNGKSGEGGRIAGGRPDGGDHLGRGGDGRAACRFPAAPPGHTCRAGRVPRGDGRRRRARSRASPDPAGQLLRARRGPHARQGESRRSCARLSRQSALDDDPDRRADPAYARRAHRFL